jgi:DNA-binding protein HU-beta
MMEKDASGKEVGMYKTEVVRRIAKQTRLSRRAVNDVLGASHRLIGESLRAGETVTFPGFGTFYTGQRKAGTVRHVRTGQTVDVPARRVAAFRVGDVLKRAVAGKRRRRWGVLGR